MSGRIDVANYENHILIESARKKLQQRIKEQNAAGVKNEVALKASAEGILTAKEIELLQYISSDFKILLSNGCKVRSEANIQHLKHIMTLSEALKCVESGAGSYGGHVARMVGAPGPNNGHNTVREHERIHTSNFTAGESKKLIAKAKPLNHDSFDPNPEGGSLSFGRKTLNLHNSDLDVNDISERARVAKEIEQYNEIYEIRRKELKKKAIKTSQKRVLESDAIDYRNPEFRAMLDLPNPGESRDVMFSDTYHAQKAVEKEKAETEHVKNTRKNQERLLREQEESCSPKQQLAAKMDRKFHKRARIWRYFLTKLHASCEHLTTKALDDLIFLKEPVELVKDLICYFCIILGLTPDWHVAQRSLFKETKSFLSFLRMINPLDVPIRRLRKASSFKKESAIAELTVDLARNASTLSVVEQLALWVINFDTLAGFAIAAEERKDKVASEEPFSQDPGQASTGTQGSPDSHPDPSAKEALNIDASQRCKKGKAAQKPANKAKEASELHRHQELLLRAKRKYKHSGLKIIVDANERRTPKSSPERLSAASPVGDSSILSTGNKLFEDLQIMGKKENGSDKKTKSTKVPIEKSFDAYTREHHKTSKSPDFRVYFAPNGAASIGAGTEHHGEAICNARLADSLKWHQTSKENEFFQNMVKSAALLDQDTRHSDIYPTIATNTSSKNNTATVLSLDRQGYMSKDAYSRESESMASPHEQVPPSGHNEDSRQNLDKSPKRNNAAQQEIDQYAEEFDPYDLYDAEWEES
jgi:hypothetical protein